jgi:putative transcriptional regulator
MGFTGSLVYLGRVDWPCACPDVAEVGRCHFVGSNHSIRASTAIPVKNRIRVLRAERDLSQADLASFLGVSRQTVNSLETGKYDPSLPLAFKIARHFGLPIEAIFDDGEAEPSNAAANKRDVYLRFAEELKLRS